MTTDSSPLSRHDATQHLPRSAGRLQVEGAEIHYEVCGRGPAIVFAHGLGGNQLSWWQQVGFFAPTHTCVTFAHRGFTPSTVQTGAPDPSHFAQDLAVLLDHLGIERSFLVGQSMGGWTVVEFTLRHPERVMGLVLSATTGSIDPIGSTTPRAQTVAAWRQRAAETQAQCRSAGVHPAAGLRMAGEQPALHRLYQSIDELSRGLDKEALRSRLQAMRVRSSNSLAATQIPVLVVSPDEDIVIPPVALHALVGQLPAARLSTLPRTGHSPYFERAEAFNECLAAFLQNPTG